VVTYCAYYFNKSNEYENLIVDTDYLTTLKTRTFKNSEFLNNGSSIVLDINTPFLISFKSYTIS